MSSEDIRGGFTIVGAAIGGYFGGPWGAAIGAQIGGAVGGVVAPGKLPTIRGPRLNDLRVQSSALGAPVPVAFGMVRLAGNLIWSSGIIETKNKTRTGGKGTPEQKIIEYTYKTNCAVGICEPPDTTLGIVGIRRVWANETIIFDARPQQAGESNADYDDRIAANAELAMQVRLGDESQEPDEVLEAWLGVGQVPGFRGLCYVVFENFELAGFGNRTPSFTFEVATTGTAAAEEYAGTVYPTWSDNLNDPRRDGYTYEYLLGELPTAYDSWIGPVDWSSDLTAVQNGVSGRSGEYSNVAGYITTQAGTVLASQGGPALGVGTADTDDKYGPFFILTYGFAEIDNSGATCNAFNAAGATGTGDALITANFATGSANNSFSYGERCPLGFLPTPVPAWADATQSCGTGTVDTTRGIYYQASLSARIRRVEQAPLDDGQGDWVEDTVRTYKRLAELSITGTLGQEYVDQYPVDPILPDDHPSYSSQVFWESAYTAAVVEGTMPAGLTYGVDYPVIAATGYYRVPGVTTISDVQAVTIGEIVENVCARAGLTQVDVSELTEGVIGYTVSRVMDARAAIEPLRLAQSFDAVESGFELKFPARGAAAVATIAADDLAAHVSGEQRPSAAEVNRIQDVELPKMLRLKYINYNRDYEPGETSAARLTTDAVNAVDVEMPIVLTDDLAQQRAEVLLYEAWTERNQYKISLDQSYMWLEPADVLEVPIDGFNERFRISTISHRLPGVLVLEGVRDDDGVYVSYAVAPPQAIISKAINYAGATTITLLDLPAINDSDSDGGYYVAALGAGNSWGGANIFTSVDGGDTYALAGEITGEAITANIEGDVPAGISTTWDEVNTITLDADVTADFESRTNRAIHEGANLAAIGAAGRWELVQFRTAELLGSPARWVLSGLLRGRKGTEQHIGSTVDGDKFVLLSEGGLVRIPVSVGSIGQEVLIKAVTLGKSLDTVTAQSFTPSGAALMPFAPVGVTGERDGSGNLTVSWVRRDRLSRELLSGTDIPNSEANESYELEVLDNGAVVRTVSVSGQTTYEYTAANQGADFGSPLPSSVTVRIYQISATVGRGHSVEATL